MIDINLEDTLKLSRFVSIVSIAVLAISMFSQTAFAHERRTVGQYNLVAGWIVEPALEGQKNGIDLRVTTGTDAKPVEGLEKTLKVEITHIDTGTTKVFDIRTIFRDPGHYTNDLLLTAPGNYSLRFFGNIESLAINETFTSSPTTFGDVDPIADIQFPIKLSSAREIDSGVKGAQSASTQAQVEARDAKDSASSARLLAIVGIAAGAIGIGLGAASFSAARKRK